MNALRPSALFFGLLTDIGGTWLLTSFVLALDSRYAAMSPEDQAAALAMAPAMWVLGSLTTYLGGFVAGHLAVGEELGNAFAVGIASTVFSFIEILSEPPTAPFWVEAAALLITIPLACGGGLTRAALRSRT